MVTTSGTPGNLASSAFTSGADACTSPTDTACTQMLRPPVHRRAEAETLRESLPVAAVAEAAQRHGAEHDGRQ